VPSRLKALTRSSNLPAMKSSTPVGRFLANELWKHRSELGLSVLCAIVMAAANIALYDLIRRLFDDALKAQNMHKALVACAVLVALFVVDGLVTYGNRIFLRLATERIVFRLRSQLFERFTVFSHLQLSAYDSGMALGMIINDMTVISNGLHVVADLIQSPILIVGILGYLLHLNWKLTLVCLVTIPSIGWVGKVLGRSAHRNQSRIQDALRSISAHIVDSLRGLRTAHAFNRSKALRDDFMNYNQKNMKHAIKLASVEEVVAPLTKLVSTIAAAGLISFGAYLVVMDHSLTEGALLAFLSAAGGMLQPLRQLNTVNVRLQSVFAAAERMKNVLEEDLDSLGLDQKKALYATENSAEARPGAVQSLQFENVSFQYPERIASSDRRSKPHDEWALKNVNLKIQSGQSLALVGTSGSGKSTLSQVALRFLDPTQGRLLLNGCDVREIPLNQFRSHFSYVSQDVHLFQKSLRQNMQLAKPEASEAEIWSALERAAISEFVRSLPGGLDTELGEQASKISGGERQRLGIARAFLRDAPILILDEITSQLDSKSEEKIHLALKELFRGRTVLMIAHRLSTIREADRVVVMEEGSIIEEGSPKELMEKPGSAFGGFWRSQNRAVDEVHNS
jgi:subfamily B ATP-binding cassette protein MsbA